MYKKANLSIFLLFCIITIVIPNLSEASCTASTRKGKVTRYGYPGDKNYDTGSAKHKGNRSNQLRGIADGHQELRKVNGKWSVQVHPGSCAVLGLSKSKILGKSTNKSPSGSLSVNPLLELTLGNGAKRKCCWEDSGSDSTADNTILKNPSNPQIVVDLFDPLDKLKSVQDANICEVKIIGECLNEKYKGISPKEGAVLAPVEKILPLSILNEIKNGPKIDQPCCLDADMI